MNNLYYYLLMIRPYPRNYYGFKFGNRVYDDWYCDWCAPEDLEKYVFYLWNLNKDNLKLEGRMGFKLFFELEYIIFKDSPIAFKIPMEGLGIIKKKS